MADAVTTQILENGNNWWSYSFTNLSDGTGESGVVKVDGSAAGPLGGDALGGGLVEVDLGLRGALAQHVEDVGGDGYGSGGVVGELRGDGLRGGHD